MTGQRGFPPALGAHLELNRILAKSLEKLAMVEGLTVLEVAARCLLVGKVPTVPAFTIEVVTAFKRLENELTRGPVLEVNA